MTDASFSRPWTGVVGGENNTSIALRLVGGNNQLKSHNITVEGHRTSVRLEAAMWEALKDIAVLERESVNGVVSAVANRRIRSGSLTSAIRIFVMAYFRAKAEARERGH